MAAGLQSLRAGMASSSKLSARLFAAAEGVWGGRSPSGEEMAAEIQFRRTSELARPRLRPGADSHSRNDHADLLWPVGERSISMSLRKVRTNPISVAHAGVVLGESGCGCDRYVGYLLAPPVFLFASAGNFGGHSDRKCLRERAAEPVSGSGLSAAAKSLDGTLAHVSAGGATLWPARAWPQRLAQPRSCRFHTTCAAQDGHLDGTVAGSRTKVGEH